jgi:adenosylhomocysteine nucleosidase|tara:strand:+ start:313 stop:927 length:615 start_codon:yes stop_codon:yes gene_type:complete
MNKKDIVIVCALEQELNGKLDGILPDPRQIIYTGVGKVNATGQLTERLHSSHLHYLPEMPKLVINYGTAGSRKLPIGELVDCTKFTQRDMDVRGLGFMLGQTPFENKVPIILDYDHVEFNPIGKKLRCGTGDNFVQGDKLIPYSDVYDMEAYALAKVCHVYNVDFISFKYITDNANESSSKDWEENCSDGVIEFKEKVLDELAT